MPEMVALYVDGFNLYHAIDELRKDHLKWLDLWALGELIIPRHTQRLSRVVYCTAVKTTDTAKMLRHRQYIKALEAKGVKCLKGHFSTEQTECFGCGLTGSAQVEKQGDVNLAISVVRDAFTGVFDHAYLLTSDGDQVATVKMLKDQFPCKRLITIAPPRRSHNKMILDLADGKITISELHLERCLFPGRAVMAPDGRSVAAIRPKEYDPPPGWVHPSCRPKR